MQLLTLLASLLPYTFALPTLKDARQTWTVTRLDYHYMTEYPGFGPPHNPWPAGSEFETTISLDVSIPDKKAPTGSWNATCERSWQHGTLPDSGAECHGQQPDNKDELDGMGGVTFWIAEWQIPGTKVPPGSPAEMPFLLGVARVFESERGAQWAGSATISCDNSSAPTSYATCVTSHPLDGMRCKLGGIGNIDLSNRKKLEIVALLYYGSE